MTNGESASLTKGGREGVAAQWLGEGEGERR